jgi:hypothetical protein
MLFLARESFLPSRFLRNVGSNWTNQRHMPEYGILRSYRRENLKSYIINITL